MKNKNTKKLSPITARVLTYALFACLCHGVAVCLFALLNPYGYPRTYLAATVTYMLEHTLMSVALTMIGSFVLQLEQNKKSE